MSRGLGDVYKRQEKEYAIGVVEVCFINLVTKKPQKFPDDLLLIFD